MLSIGVYLAKAASTVWAWVRSNGHWKLVVAAMTAATVILLVHQYRVSMRETAALKEDLTVARGEVVLLEQARVSDSIAVAATVAAKGAIAQTEAEQRIETDKAIKANPVWANEPIPADVIRSLSM